MKPLLIALPALVLCTACLSPSPDRVNATGDGTAITLPMDPGQISCRQIAASPAYLTPAAEWITGQLRAAMMRGAFSGPANEAATARALQGYCELNPEGRARSATSSLIAALG